MSIDDIMRLAPVAIRHWPDRDTLLRVARDQSRTTHAAAEALEACEALALILADAVAGQSLPEIVTGAAGRVKGFRPGQAREEVRGTGYVVASLHAATWAVSRPRRRSPRATYGRGTASSSRPTTSFARSSCRHSKAPEHRLRVS